MAELVEDKVLVEEKRERDRLIGKGFGELEGRKLVLDLKEALYLLEKEKLAVKKGKRKVKEKELLALGEKGEKKFYSKFLVFRDLRDRGFVVKTGFKFGFDLRVYPRGKKPGEEHTQWCVHIATEGQSLRMPSLSRMVRLAGNINTVVLLAVVDSENDINYYEIERIIP